jgi:hypothetical protein
MPDSHGSGAPGVHVRSPDYAAINPERVHNACLLKLEVESNIEAQCPILVGDRLFQLGFLQGLPRIRFFSSAHWFYINSGRRGCVFS